MMPMRQHGSCTTVALQEASRQACEKCFPGLGMGNHSRSLVPLPAFDVKVSFHTRLNVIRGGLR